MVEEVENICDTIEEFKRGDGHVVLVLATYQQLGTIPITHKEMMLRPYYYAGRVLLRELLSDGARIPSKLRSLLAPRLASSLLQLLQLLQTPRQSSVPLHSGHDRG